MFPFNTKNTIFVHVLQARAFGAETFNKKNVPCSGRERPEQVIRGFPQVNHMKNDVSPREHVHIIGDYLDTRTSIPTTVHHATNVTPTTLTKSTREGLWVEQTSFPLVQKGVSVCQIAKSTGKKNLSSRSVSLRFFFVPLSPLSLSLTLSF